MSPAVQKKEMRKEKNKVSRGQIMLPKNQWKFVLLSSMEKTTETQNLVILPSVNVAKIKHDTLFRDGRLLAHISVLM